MITAGAFNRWRIIPRLAVLLYGLLCYHVVDWFMLLPDPSTQQTTFATALLGAAAVWFGFYVNSGNSR